jgi:hypothetical protein
MVPVVALQIPVPNELRVPTMQDHVVQLLHGRVQVPMVVRMRVVVSTIPHVSPVRSHGDELSRMVPLPQHMRHHQLPVEVLVRVRHAPVSMESSVEPIQMVHVLRLLVLVVPVVLLVVLLPQPHQLQVSVLLVLRVQQLQRQIGTLGPVLRIALLRAVLLLVNTPSHGVLREEQHRVRVRNPSLMALLSGRFRRRPSLAMHLSDGLRRSLAEQRSQQVLLSQRIPPTMLSGDQLVSVVVPTVLDHSLLLLPISVL